MTTIPSRAEAQVASTEGVYVSAGLLTDIKRFSGDPTDNILDGEAVGAAVALGTSIGTRWSLELGLDVPRSTETIHERSFMLRSSTVTLQSITRNRAISVSALVRLRSATRGRLQLGYLAGISFLRMRREFETVASDVVSPSLIPRPVQSVDYASAPTVGVDAHITVGRRLSIVPAIHAMAFTVDEDSGIVVRPRVGVRWTF